MNLKKFKPSVKTRKWIYGLGVAAAPLLVAYGITSNEDAALWVAALYSFLGFGMATGNTKVEK